MAHERLSFDPVADAYDRARPGYPDAVFDALEAATRPLAGAEVAWTRRADLDTWLLDERSKSYVSALGEDDRQRLLDGIAEVLRRAFPTGELAVPYETWLWTARARSRDQPPGTAADGP